MNKNMMFFLGLFLCAPSFHYAMNNEGQLEKQLQALGWQLTKADYAKVRIAIISDDAGEAVQYSIDNIEECSYIASLTKSGSFEGFKYFKKSYKPLDNPSLCFNALKAMYDAAHSQPAKAAK